MKKSVWLHNIRSVYNVASVFRTADAGGIQHIYLSGYTPHPIDRFGRKREDFAKVALGAEESVSWSFLQNPYTFFRERESSVVLIGVEQDERAEDLFRFSLPPANEIVIVLGEETEGMDEEQRALCDTLVEIPMYGKKESLNVSVAFGVAVYCIFGRG